MPLRSFYARAQSLSLTSYNLCDFRRIHAHVRRWARPVLTVLLVAWRIAIGFRFVAYSTGGFNLNLNGLLMD
jgi:hypothetical protein